MGMGHSHHRANRCTACPPRVSRGPIKSSKGRELFCREKPTWRILGEARRAARDCGAAPGSAGLWCRGVPGRRAAHSTYQPDWDALGVQNNRVRPRPPCRDTYQWGRSLAAVEPISVQRAAPPLVWSSQKRQGEGAVLPRKACVGAEAGVVGPLLGWTMGILERRSLRLARSLRPPRRAGLRSLTSDPDSDSRQASPAKKARVEQNEQGSPLSAEQLVRIQRNKAAALLRLATRNVPAGLGESWKQQLCGEFGKPYFVKVGGRGSSQPPPVPSLSVPHLTRMPGCLG